MPPKENKLAVKKLVVGQLQTNCYLIFDKENKETVIVDPGDDADYIIRIVLDLELEPVKIIATHGHYDHILGVTELKLAFGTPFLMSKKDEFLLSRAGSSASYFSGLKTDPVPKIDHYLKEGSVIKIGHSFLKVIETPGHTPGSICLHSGKEKAFFVGDVIFAGGAIGRTDFKYSSNKDLEKSIKKVLKFPKDTVIYSGHGLETTIEMLI